MLSVEQIAILEAVERDGYLSSAQLRAAFGRDGVERARALMDREGLLVFASNPDDGSEGYALSVRGKDFLSVERARQAEAVKRRAEEEERRQQQDAKEDLKQRREHVHDYRVALFECILAFVLGLVAEHFVGIVARLCALLGVR